MRVFVFSLAEAFCGCPVLAKILLFVRKERRASPLALCKATVDIYLSPAYNTKQSRKTCEQEEYPERAVSKRAADGGIAAEGLSANGLARAERTAKCPVAADGDRTRYQGGAYGST